MARDLLSRLAPRRSNVRTLGTRGACRGDSARSGRSLHLEVPRAAMLVAFSVALAVVTGAAVAPAATEAAPIHGAEQHAANLSQETVSALKRKMKQVVQTRDSRTVRRRLMRLDSQETADQCGINTWIAGVSERLVQLIPSLRPNPYPRTTNSLERFFRAFQRFYTTRGGFHSVMSAQRELMLFVVGYVFTIRISTGRAPIEKVVPQAKEMPLYKLLNDPFRYGLANMCHAKSREAKNMATREVVLKLKSP